MLSVGLDVPEDCVGYSEAIFLNAESRPVLPRGELDPLAVCYTPAIEEQNLQT